MSHACWGIACDGKCGQRQCPNNFDVVCEKSEAPAEPDMAGGGSPWAQRQMRVSAPLPAPYVSLSTAGSAMLDTPLPAPAKQDEKDAIIIALVDDLNWALDVMTMYERRLLDFGDPKELLHSAVHINRINGARGHVEYAWQALREDSNCRHCRSGNVPLEGWHTFLSEWDKDPCTHTEVTK